MHVSTRPLLKCYDGSTSCIAQDDNGHVDASKHDATAGVLKHSTKEAPAVVQSAALCAIQVRIWCDVQGCGRVVAHCGIHNQPR